MNAPGPRRASARDPLGSFPTPLALQCARTVHQAVDRRMPEAAALAGWLAEHAAVFGLRDGAVPDHENCRLRPRGVAAADWRKIGTALAMVTHGPETTEVAADSWVASIGERLGLDALEARILALALHYRLDERGGTAVERDQRVP